MYPECLKSVSRKEFYVAWHSLQLPEQRVGLFDLRSRSMRKGCDGENEKWKIRVKIEVHYQLSTKVIRHLSHLTDAFYPEI